MQPLHLTLSASVPAAPIRTTDRARAVAALFGIPIHPAPRSLFQNLRLTLRPADILLITGPSGAGKSTLLRTLAASLPPSLPVTRLSQIETPSNLPVVDTFPCPLEETLAHLSRAGLSEAHLLLRAPAELSEGQQFRYRLAQFFASSHSLLLADEFAATLDRISARALAFQLAKFIRRSNRIAILATTHEDLTPDLNPSQRLYLPLTGPINLDHLY